MDRTLTAAVVFFLLTLGQPITRAVMGPAFDFFQDIALFVAEAGELPH